MNDIYTWQVTYRDGWITQEYDAANPNGRGWASIEHAQVRTIELLQYGQIIHSMDIPANAMPVCLRRRTIEIDPDRGMEIASLAKDHQDEQVALMVADSILSNAPRSTVHCIGWKNEETAQYLFVFPDNSTLLTDDFNAV